MSHGAHKASALQYAVTLSAVAVLSGVGMSPATAQALENGYDAAAVAEFPSCDEGGADGAGIAAGEVDDDAPDVSADGKGDAGGTFEGSGDVAPGSDEGVESSPGAAMGAGQAADIAPDAESAPSEEPDISEGSAAADTPKEEDTSSDVVVGETSEGTLVSDNKGYRFILADGSYATKRFIDVNGRRYYFDEAGYACVGISTIDGLLYYFGADGALRSNVWYAWDDGRRSFFSANYHGGAAVQGVWWTVSGKRRYFGDDARLLTDEIAEIDGYLYWLNGDGVARSNTWYTWGDGRRSFFSGKFHKGAAIKDRWWTVAGKRRYFALDSKLLTGQFAHIGGYLFWLDSDGAAKTNVWHTWEDGSKSFFSGNFQKGAAVQGKWWTVSGKKRYFGGDAKLASNQVANINGYLYLLGKDGAKRSNTWYTWEDGRKSFFSRNYSNGAAVRGRWKISGKYYFFDTDSCKKAIGWRTWGDGKRSYFSAKLGGAAPVSTSWTVSGQKYWFDSVGAMRTGWVAWNAGGVSCFSPDGIIYIGSHHLNGIDVWFDSSGKASMTPQIRMVVRAQKCTSSSNYLMLVDTTNNYVGVFVPGSTGWDLARYMLCSSGAYGVHQTPSGTYQIGYRGYVFGHGYSCYYYTQIHNGILFHSIKYYQGTHTVMDGRLGEHISDGCIRLAIDDAKWIYDNIPAGTTVRVYRP